MRPDEYVNLAMRTESLPTDETAERIASEEEHETMRLLHAAMGMCTEAGEAQDALKRHFFYGAELDPVNLQEEIGDMLWYCAQMCSALGVSMEKIMERNIAKLRARYPDRFNEEDAVNRDLKKERDVLEE
jgi:NTP pyrophosphatase (non-canonical NTP hydrolase)